MQRSQKHRHALEFLDVGVLEHCINLSLLRELFMRKQFVAYVAIIAFVYPSPFVNVFTETSEILRLRFVCVAKIIIQPFRGGLDLFPVFYVRDQPLKRCLNASAPCVSARLRYVRIADRKCARAT